MSTPKALDILREDINATIKIGSMDILDERLVAYEHGKLEIVAYLSERTVPIKTLLKDYIKALEYREELSQALDFTKKLLVDGKHYPKGEA